jgi:hypothetical protein
MLPNRSPGDAAPFVPDFDPVPVRARHDGWTPTRQHDFIVLLAGGWCPGRAAARVGMSRKSAYALRARRGGEGFAAAWDAAIAHPRQRRIEARQPDDWGRAVEGVLRPVRHRGRIVAWDRRFDDAALIRLLRRISHLLEKQ